MAQAVGAVSMRHLAVLLLAVLTALPLHGQGAAGASRSFLYVGHWETRFEALLPLQTVAGWMQKPLARDAVVASSQRAALAEEVATAAKHWVSLVVNEVESPAANAEVLFIDSSSTAGGAPFPLDESKDVPVSAVHVALSWSAPHVSAPASVEVKLNGVFPDVSAFTVEVTAGGEAERLHFTSAKPMVRWENGGRMGPPPAPVDVPAAPEVMVKRLNLLLVAWVVLGLGLQGLLWWKRLRWPGGLLPFVFAWLIGAAMLYPMDVGSLSFRKLSVDEDRPLNAESAAEVLQALVTNTYLALSIGEAAKAEALLHSVMLPEVEEKLRARLADDLLIPNHQRLRAEVTASNVAVEVESLKLTDAGFDTPLGWTVIGVAHHLGHPDQRVNKYEGRASVEVVDGEWKITSLEITNHRQM